MSIKTSIYNITHANKLAKEKKAAEPAKSDAVSMVEGEGKSA